MFSKQITVHLLCGGLFTKRKCGDDFVYLTEGSDKTLTKTNDTMPHTWIV